ncbi:secreted protein [Streptomyces noursei]|nr:secreted protein [Streptomyces noursei]
MHIDWAALGQVFGVSLVVTVGLVGLFTVGIVGTSRKPAADGDAAATTAPGTGRAPGHWPPTGSARPRWPTGST